MRDVKVLGEFYFSQLAGKPIFDSRGQLVGRVKDMVALWDGTAPKVVGIKYSKDAKGIIPADHIKTWDYSGLRLKNEFDKAMTREIEENEIYISRWLLDKQIIDLSGAKLVRVNDIVLSWAAHQNTQYVVLTAVDIGIRGLFRRLGIEGLVTRWEHSFLGWQYINPLENRTSNLQLNQEKQQIAQLHPADIAEVVEEMDYKKRLHFIENLDSLRAGKALEEMELETQVEIIEHMDGKRASDILEELPLDDIVDILSELPTEKSREILNMMEPEDVVELQKLMYYPKNTAGSLMTTEYVTVSADVTAENAINRLRELAPTAETIYYIYVTDEHETLQGVLSLRELILTQPQMVVSDLMKRNVVAVHDHDEHRKVADTVHKYGLLAVPVVNQQNTLLGIITVDDVLELLISNRGKTETLSRFMAGKRAGRGWK